MPEELVLRRTIMLCADPPDAVEDDDHLWLLRRAGVVFEIDARATAAMHRHGVRARTLRPGYSRLRDRYDADRSRPIDVMFVGAHSLRRTKHLRQCARVLARRNCLLQFSREPMAGAEIPSFLGDGRWPLLAQTKIVLNLHREDDTNFEWLRATDAIHAGAVVVSEHSSAISSLEPGRHLLVASVESLPYVIDRLLDDEPRLARMRADAYERLHTWLPFSLSASIFRAAVVEVLGAPLHAGVALRGVGRPRDDDGSLARDGDTPVRDAADGEVRRRLDEAHAELLEVRSELVQVRREAASLRRALVPGAGTELAQQSPAWEARSRPRVTVLTVSHESRLQLAETLDSVAGSRTADLELVITDSGSTDGSLAIAERWVRDHPRIPSVVIADRTDRGRGAARNLGLEFARGETILVLDPGATIYSHCLPRLADSLAAMDDVAFVYPIIEVSSDSEWFVRAGGDNLLNLFVWEPDRLRSGNIVHAPYLVNADVLTTLGGYATDPALDGFEDYDLWCRVAERGWRGQLIAQVLARRSEVPGRSCLPTLAPPEGPATSALVSRAPSALAGAFTR